MDEAVSFFARGVSVAVIEPSVDETETADTLDSLAFAFAAADAAADATADAGGWLSSHSDTLSNLGWGLKEFRVSSVDASTDRATAAKSRLVSLTCLVAGDPVQLRCVGLLSPSVPGDKSQIREVSDGSYVLDATVFAKVRDAVHDRIPADGRYLPLT